MTDRATIESILKNAYAARVRGDVEAMVGLFAGGAEFRLAGAGHASPVALRCTDAEAIRGALAGLVQAFAFEDHEILSLVIEGEKAAAHTRVRVRSTATGEEETTEMADLVTFRDGKIVSFLEFCDTALAARMLAAPA